MIYDIKIII